MQRNIKTEFSKFEKYKDAILHGGCIMKNKFVIVTISTKTEYKWGDQMEAAQRNSINPDNRKDGEKSGIQ